MCYSFGSVKQFCFIAACLKQWKKNCKFTHRNESRLGFFIGLYNNKSKTWRKISLLVFEFYKCWVKV